MKKYIWLLLLVFTSTFIACKSKPVEGQKDDTRILMQDNTDSHGIRRMQVSKAENTVTFKGKEYHFTISRTPDESLDKVKSETGDLFVDNKIVLRITQGSRETFNKSFTKKDFASLVGRDFLTKSILEGMVYDKTTPQGIVFAASVCYPQTDLYVPVAITIAADGKMSMAKEEMMQEVYESDDV